MTKRKDKLIHVKYFEEVFCSYVYLVIGNYSDFLKWFQKEFPSDTETLEELKGEEDYEIIPGSCFEIKEDDSSYSVVIWLKEFDKDDPQHRGTLSHELIHTSFNIFKAVGVEVNEYTEEVFCCLNECLLRNFLEKI